ncbi:hypothetical protein [Cellulomonas sp.]|nr:hypothetical protein [Cellulomonas sp.]
MIRTTSTCRSTDRAEGTLPGYLFAEPCLHLMRKTHGRAPTH